MFNKKTHLKNWFAINLAINSSEIYLNYLKLPCLFPNIYLIYIKQYDYSFKFATNYNFLCQIIIDILMYYSCKLRFIKDYFNLLILHLIICVVRFFE